MSEKKRHITEQEQQSGPSRSITWTQKAEKSVSFDFDGVIHQYSKGWYTKDIYDPPMAGAYEALIDLSRLMHKYKDDSVIDVHGYMMCYDWVVTDKKPEA
jgi:hypothetical protein